MDNILVTKSQITFISIKIIYWESLQHTIWYKAFFLSFIVDEEENR